MSKRRVVITGMGIVSPVGSTLDDAWRSIREGISGIRMIDEFDASGFATQIAGTVRDFDIADYLVAKDARKMDRFMHYGIAASVDALKDSGLEITDANGHRIGVAMGAGIGGLETIEANHDKYRNGGPRKVSPFFIPGSIINMVSGNIDLHQLSPF